MRPIASRAARLLAAVVATMVLATHASGQDTRPATTSARAEANLWNCTGSPDDLPKADPTGGEIPLPKATASWNPFHLFTSDTWRIHAIGAGHLTRADGPAEVLFMDELGRCILLTGDSGKWIPRVLVEDTASMSAWAAGELDPRIRGTELYMGGGSGRIHRMLPVTKKRQFGSNSARPAAAPAAESPASEVVGFAEGASLSKFILGDIDPSHPGNEMLALTNNGPVYDIRPDPASERGMIVEQIGDLGSRARDGVLLPATAARPPRIAALLETGEVALLVRTPTGFDRTSLCKEDVSIARLARRAPVVGELEVVYVARIDGLILRFAEQLDGSWARDVIYVGPNGPRGLAAGRFDADPRVETVAVFGYSKKVQLLSHAAPGPWKVETIHVDNGGGHWLTAGELDGRNTTDELVGGGFGYHVFMITRVPGYGFSGVAVDPDGGIPDYKLPDKTGPRQPPERAVERDSDQPAPNGSRTPPVTTQHSGAPPGSRGAP